MLQIGFAPFNLLLFCVQSSSGIFERNFVWWLLTFSHLFSFHLLEYIMQARPNEKNEGKQFTFHSAYVTLVFRKTP
jgi:hypothetical protein